MSATTAILPATVVPIKDRGNKAFSSGQFSLAVEEYTDAIKLAPTYAPLYSNRAAAYLGLHELPKALQDAKSATGIDEGWAKGWIRLSEVMLAISQAETDPVGIKLLLEAVGETYGNALGLLLSEGDPRTQNQREGSWYTVLIRVWSFVDVITEIKRRMILNRDKISSL